MWLRDGGDETKKNKESKNRPIKHQDQAFEKIKKSEELVFFRISRRGSSIDPTSFPSRPVPVMTFGIS
jgi:hypothetical protein